MSGISPGNKVSFWNEEDGKFVEDEGAPANLNAVSCGENGVWGVGKDNKVWHRKTR